MKSIAVVLVACLSIAVGQKFDSRYVGVAYSPYTDHPQARPWDQYTINDIQAQLTVIRQYFTNIASYGMGAAHYNRAKNWDQCDSNALVARAAAELNRQNNRKFRVNIGVHQIKDDGDQNREIENAFSAADDANRRSGGTVWGITFTNEYVKHGEAWKGERIFNMIQKNKDKARGKRLQIGTRTEICDAVFKEGGLRDVMQRIVRNSNYIYCNIYPSKDHARMGPERAAQEVGKYYFQLRDEIRKVNGNIEVMIGETGWPSQDNSFNESHNTVQNQVAYWKAIAKWAAQNRIQTMMFQAIDEPWKGPNSPYKAESHYGWWRKPENRNNRFIEKETGAVSQV